MAGEGTCHLRWGLCGLCCLLVAHGYSFLRWRMRARLLCQSQMSQGCRGLFCLPEGPRLVGRTLLQNAWQISALLSVHTAPAQLLKMNIAWRR